MTPPNIIYFPGAAGFREWLAARHADTAELWVGFYKKDSGRVGITYREAVEEALCFGWIDGIKKRVDELSYTHRFTPRQAKSTWSRVNIELAERLIAAGRMMPSGLRAYAAREAERSGIYSFENAPRELSPRDEAQFRADHDAWDFFQRQPPGYRRTSIWWVVSAKREETRARRLAQLIADSRGGRRLVIAMGSHLNS